MRGAGGGGVSGKRVVNSVGIEMTGDAQGYGAIIFCTEINTSRGSSHLDL